MAQDIRDLFEKNIAHKNNVTMSRGHEDRFVQLLDKELPQGKRKSSFNFFTIAASVIVLIGLTYGAFTIFPNSEANSIEYNNRIGGKLKSLGDISPDLKKVEDYYLASINLELSKLELTPENKDLVDGYMSRLKELNEEYDRLTIEWNESGLNEKTLNASIDNLKLRLNLLLRLKAQLQEFNEESFKEEVI